MPTATVIPSISIEALVAARQNAIDAIAKARDLMRAAAEQLAPFDAEPPTLCLEFGGNVHRDITDDRYWEPIEREVDRKIWVQLFAMTGVSTAMDHRTRNELFDRLHTSKPFSVDENELPPLTEENVEATFRQLKQDLPEYFERCIDSVYRALSWEHYTNEPSRLKQRMIVNGAFYQWRRALQGDTVRIDRHESLHDLERVLLILDRQELGTHGNGLRGLGDIPWGTWVEVPSPQKDGRSLFSVKCHRNGTTHVKIHDKAHVERMNLIMANRYPGTLTPPRKAAARAQRQQARQPKATGGTVQQRQQAFYTPREIADQLAEAADLRSWSRVLEPSAGEGSLVRAALRARCNNVTAVENDQAALVNLGHLADRNSERVNVVPGDFFSIPEDPSYDVVLMNPPFANAQEVEHVLRAWEFVKPGGRLVSVMSAAVQHRKDGRYRAFAEFLELHGGEVRELPERAFRESGTDVRTVMVTIEKPAEKAER